MSWTKLGRIAAAAVVLSWFAASAQAQTAAGCSTSVASLKGWYGLLISGGNLAAGSAKYQAGALLFDGVGGVTGSNVYGGSGSHDSAVGKYVLNSDCTLTLNLTVGSTASSFTVALKITGEAVGIEVDSSAVANISLKPQYASYTPGLYFNSSALNGTFAASCSGPLSASTDLNRSVFKNGALSGTDPYNNDGSFAVSNVPFAGTYTANSDGTFAGALTVLGTPFDYYGVIDSLNTEVEYIYANVANGVATDAFASCSGGAAASPAAAVNLSTYYNINAVVTNGKSPTNGGLDGSYYALLESYVGSSVFWGGASFHIGPANAPDAVSNAKIALASGSYSTLAILATTAFGPQTGTYIVTYTDGSTSTFTQESSDWGAPGNLAGESIALAMPYRVMPNGATQGSGWYLYGYSFALSKSKKVASLTLPTSGNIKVFSAVLMP